MKIAKSKPRGTGFAPPRDAGVDFGLLAVARRRWPWLAVSVALSVTVALVVTSQMAPQYTGVAAVMINPRQHEAPQAAAGTDEVTGGWPSDSSILDTEVEVLKSRALAERVVDSLKLDTDPELNGVRPTGLSAHLVGVAQALKRAMGRSSNLPVQSHAVAHEAVVESVLGKLGVKRTGETYIVQISFGSSNPEKAALVANSFADEYLSQRLEARFETAQQASQWLNQRLAQLQPQVKAAETAVQQFKAQHGLLTSVGSSVTEQEISNLNNELDQAKADATEKDARVATARQQAQGGAGPDVLSGPLNSPTVAGLRAQQAAASSKVADLQTKYGPKHPEVQRAQRELADINDQINKEIARDVANLQSEDEVAHQRVASLESSLAGAKGTLVGNNAASVELTDLQRRADATSALYASLLNRAQQASVDQVNEQSDARVVSHATTPPAPGPKTALGIAVGAVFGLAAGTVAIFVLEMLDSGIVTADEVSHTFSLSHLGSVPLLESTVSGRRRKLAAPSDYVLERPLSAFAEAFRNLRASIVFSQVGEAVRVIALASALPNEGKSTTAVCLGQAMAVAGSRVVVVDCDLRHVSVSGSTSFGHLADADRSIGLVEVLQGTAKLEDALICDEISGAWYLAISNAKTAPTDLFGSAAVDHLIQRLRDTFDYVILDTPPVVAVSDTRLLATKCDAVIILARWRKTPKRAVQTAISLLTSVGATLAGVVLTCVDARQQTGYGQTDAGYYYKQVRQYYIQ